MGTLTPGDVVEVLYLDDENDDAEVLAYRGVVQGPARRGGDYVVKVTEVFDDDMNCEPGDLLAPILGIDGAVMLRKVG